MFIEKSFELRELLSVSLSRSSRQISLLVFGSERFVDQCLAVRCPIAYVCMEIQLPDEFFTATSVRLPPKYSTHRSNREPDQATIRSIRRTHWRFIFTRGRRKGE